MRFWLLFFFCFLSLTGWSQQDEQKEIDKTINKFLTFLSFPDSSSVMIDSLSTVFIADAKLIVNFGKKPIVFTIPQYIENMRNSIRSGQLYSSKEREIARKVDIFGKIAHVFSTYELTMIGKDGKIVRRGINSIQLLKQDNRWLIGSLVWDRENDTLKIPDKYLKNQ